jgi:hypothetical protein
MSITKAFAFGQNLVDWNNPAYPGWDGRLNAACNDAAWLADIAAQFGWQVDTHYSRWSRGTPYRPLFNASRTRWRMAWAEVATAPAGSKFVFLNSGHGWRETYGLSSTEGLCFADGLWTDWEQADLYAAIPAGVEVVVIIDACHSQGFALGKSGGVGILGVPKSAPFIPLSKPAPRGWLQQSPAGSLLQLSACLPDEVAMDGEVNGAFTGSLAHTLKNYERSGMTWGEWFTRTQMYMSSDRELDRQHPRADEMGVPGLLARRIFN